jgi:hypothetical protein
MSITKEQMTEATKAAAAEIAAKLGMHEEMDVTMLCSDQPILIASAKGIETGTVKVCHGEMRTMRYTAYKLNDETLFEERYAITEQGWADEATTETFLDEDVTLYTGW